MGGGSAMANLAPMENLALGCTAGVMTKLCNYPLLNWKNASQQGLPIALNPAQVYRGLPMACLNLGGTTAVQFWFTGVFQKILAGPDGKMTDGQEMGAAFLGGMASGIPCCVWELTMIQQQRFGGSILGTPMRLLADSGAASLARGMVTTIGRESLYTMAMLGLCPVVQRTLVEEYEMDPGVALAAGAFGSSIFSATLTHPLDTIKTCMQGDVEQVKYKGITSTGKNLAAEYGVAQGLFKGLAWRITLISTTFFLVNKFKQSLAPVMFKEKFPADV